MELERKMQQQKEEIERMRQIEKQRKEEDLARQIEKERAEERMRKLEKELEEKRRMEEERDKEVRRINLVEDVPKTSETTSSPLTKTYEPMENETEVVYDDFSVRKPHIEVDFDDFSVKPKRWGSQAKVENRPVQSWRAEPAYEEEEVLVPVEVHRQESKAPEQVSNPDSSESTPTMVSPMEEEKGEEEEEKQPEEEELNSMDIEEGEKESEDEAEDEDMQEVNTTFSLIELECSSVCFHVWWVVSL